MGHDVCNINKLVEVLSSYLSDVDIRKVRRAYTLAEEAHRGQKRGSGEPYICHPLEVAGIVANFHMDVDCICAALLHDVVEDTTYRIEQIETGFGQTVAELVDGLTKLKTDSKRDSQAASFQKLISAMCDNYKVVLIKLADRLHNARTFAGLPPEKRLSKAEETLELFVPLARRMGMNVIRRELQLLSFKHRSPWRSRVLGQTWQDFLLEHRDYYDRLVTQLRASLAPLSANDDVQVFLWEKNIFRAYRRARRKHTPFKQQLRRAEIRIIVNSIPDCYHALGLVHALFRPKSGDFIDFVAEPKVYGYQSLLTVVLPPDAPPLTLQIQTQAMYRIAEYGIVAGTRYPELNLDIGLTKEYLRNWIDEVTIIKNSVNSSQEFFDHMRADLFLQEIYVYTPNGEIKILRNGATAIDFAYAIHTEVGNHCVAVRVNGKHRSLSKPLPNGAVVEISMDETAIPQPAWLNVVVTAKARVSIRQWLKKQRSHEALALGQQLVSNALSNFGYVLDDVDPTLLKDVVYRLGFKRQKQLWHAVASGQQCAKLLARRLINEQALQPLENQQNVPLLVKGTEGLGVHLASCCYPILGDTITAILTTDSGLQVHRSNCKKLSSNRHEQSERLSVSWADSIHQTFITPLTFTVREEVGVLADLGQLFKSLYVNIESMTLAEGSDFRKARFLLKVRDRQHLQQVIGKSRSLPFVSNIERI